MRSMLVLSILVRAALVAGCTDDGPDTSSTVQLECDSWPALDSYCSGDSVVYRCADGSEYSLDCSRTGTCKVTSIGATCEDDVLE